MAYSILPAIPIKDVLDFPNYWNETEVEKMQTEPPTVDANGDITSWPTPVDIPSTSGLAYSKFELYKDVDGYLGWWYRLRARYTLGKLYMWDGAGNPTVRIRITDGDYSNWTTVYEATFSGYNVPVVVDLTGLGYVATDIWVEVHSVSYVPKFHIWAEKINGSDLVETETSVIKQPKYGYFQRYCTLPNAPDDYIPKGTERMYFDIRWITEIRTYLTKDNIRLRFDPPNFTFSNVSADVLVGDRKLRNGGVPIQINFKELPYYTEYGDQGTTYNKLAHWVDTLTSDTRDPMSYQMAAAFFYSVTARWGSNSSMTDTYLRLMPGEVARKGLGYIDTIEIWNEMDAWWSGSLVYHDPTEMAAFFSAVIDGNNGQMGDGFGIKTADLNMKVALGGSIDLKYFLNWRVFHEMARMRGQTYAQIIDLIDQIDYHHYANDGGGQAGTRTTGVSPEDDNLVAKLQELIRIRNIHHPKSVLNIGEFGYDYNQASAQKAPPIIDNDIDKTQTAWIMRTMLLGYLAGMDHMTQYMVINSSAAERGAWGLYASSGLATSTYNQKYLSWYGVNMSAHHLYECDTIEEINLGDSAITCLKFTEAADNSYERYVVFCNTSNNTKKRNVTVPIGITMTKASKVDVIYGADNGQGYALPITANQITIPEVSELPTVILAETSAVVVPTAPSTVVLLDKNINSVRFSWQLSGFDVEAVEIWRGSIEGFETLLETILPNQTEYFDSDTGVDLKLYYKIIAKNSAGQAEVSFAVDFPTTYTVNNTYKIDLSVSGTLVTPSDFTRVDGKAIFPINDSLGNPSSITFDFVSTEWGWFNETGMSTGDDSGVVPDAVLKTHMAGADKTIPVVARIAGLDNTKSYVLKVLGSRNFIGSQKQLINLYGAGEVHESGYNTNTFTTFYSIQDVSQIDVSFLGYLGGGQYVNAIILEEVTINEIPFYPPTANAGPDQNIILPTNSTTLDGFRSTDPDGNITDYLWEQINGPNTATIVSPTSQATSVTGLIEGTYTFRLTVTDNTALTGGDQILVTVSQANPMEVRGIQSLLLI